MTNLAPVHRYVYVTAVGKMYLVLQELQQLVCGACASCSIFPEKKTEPPLLLPCRLPAALRYERLSGYPEVA